MEMESCCLLMNLWFSKYLALVAIKILFVQLNDNNLIACYNQWCNTNTKVNNFQKVWNSDTHGNMTQTFDSIKIIKLSTLTELHIVIVSIVSIKSYDPSYQ